MFKAASTALVNDETPLVSFEYQGAVRDKHCQPVAVPEVPLPTTAKWPPNTCKERSRRARIVQLQ
jgi:hypothetical protein